MAWQPVGISLLTATEQGRILITIINSLAKELARMQEEIDELKRSKK